MYECVLEYERTKEENIAKSKNRPAFVTKVSRGFPQSLKANTETAP
jgi:hypothetical protein